MGGLHIGPASTWWAVVMFAVAFLWGHELRLMDRLGVDRRSVISFSAGMGAAYVFVRVMPELNNARHDFVESIDMSLRYEGMAIYFIALAGFLFFYGFDHLRKGMDDSSSGARERAFRMDVGGFAAYAGLISYLLVRLPQDMPASAVLYAVAMTLHFLTVDHSLSERHPEAYERLGRYLLAAAVVLGWCIGLLAAAPPHVEALLLAFISGGIMVNSMITELPSEKDGRFLPFIVGGAVYGLILLPLG